VIDTLGHQLLPRQKRNVWPELIVTGLRQATPRPPGTFSAPGTDRTGPRLSTSKGRSEMR
jgi:hypothetical protein